MRPSEMKPASEIGELGHCDLCHVGTLDIYADGCCCCLMHSKHGGSVADKTMPATPKED